MCVVVQEIASEGVVGKDGRLQPGDQILEVCVSKASLVPFNLIKLGKRIKKILKNRNDIVVILKNIQVPVGGLKTLCRIVVE